MLYNFITFVWWEFLSVHGTLSGRRELHFFKYGP